jgi:hypothetical protein
MIRSNRTSFNYDGMGSFDEEPAALSSFGAIPATSQLKELQTALLRSKGSTFFAH